MLSNMAEIKHYIIFLIGGKRMALPLNKVARIARAVTVTPLPDAPELVIGVINMQGDVIPVVDIRERFNIPVTPLILEDHFIIGRTNSRLIAILVNEVLDIVDLNEKDISNQKDILPGISNIEGVIKLKENVVLIQDLDKLLSLDDFEHIDQSLETEKV